MEDISILWVPLAIGGFLLLLTIIAILKPKDRAGEIVTFSQTNEPEDWSVSEGSGTLRIIPWDEWKRSLDSFVAGRISLDDHVERFSGCVIGKKPEPPKPIAKMSDEEYKTALRNAMEPILIADDEWHSKLNEQRFAYPIVRNVASTNYFAVGTSVSFYDYKPHHCCGSCVHGW